MLRFNFAEYRESTYSKYVKPDLMFLFVVLVVVFFFSYFCYSTTTHQLKLAQSKIQTLKREIHRLRQIQQSEKELIATRKELQKKLKIVSMLDKNRKVPQFLYFFANPENVKNVWLDSLTYSGRQLTVKGGTLKIKSFPEFLKISEEKLGRVLFRETERKVYENRKLNFRVVYYKFNFGVELKNGTAR